MTGDGATTGPDPSSASTNTAREGELVFLLHGLGRTWRAMRRLERAVADAGFRTHNWDYPGRQHSIDELARQFRALLAEEAKGEACIHVVAYSLGSLVTRAALSEAPPVPPGRIVMIAPPNQGVRVPEWPALSPALKAVYGKPIEEIANPPDRLERLGVPDAEIGVIAGTRPFHPLIPASWLGSILNRQTVHDGTVERDRTHLEGLADFIEVPSQHTFICDRPEVAHQVVAFLRTGAFDHE